jgi:hypothetical protein
MDLKTAESNMREERVPMTVERIMHIVRLLPDSEPEARGDFLAALERMLHRLVAESMSKESA